MTKPSSAAIQNEKNKQIKSQIIEPYIQCMYVCMRVCVTLASLKTWMLPCGKPSLGHFMADA